MSGDVPSRCVCTRDSCVDKACLPEKNASMVSQVGDVPDILEHMSDMRQIVVSQDSVVLQPDTVGDDIDEIVSCKACMVLRVPTSFTVQCIE